MPSSPDRLPAGQESGVTNRTKTAVPIASIPENRRAGQSQTDTTYYGFAGGVARKPL